MEQVLWMAGLAAWRETGNVKGGDVTQSEGLSDPIRKEARILFLLMKPVLELLKSPDKVLQVQKTGLKAFVPLPASNN